MKTILKAALAVSVLALAPSALAGESEQENPAVEGATQAAAPEVEGEEAEDAADSALEQADAQPADATAVAADAPVAPVAGQSVEAQARVVEGAPLGNANVYVHIVERKPYTNAGRHELVLYPAVAQLNSKFTSHVGVAASYAYHLFENLSLQFTPVFHYVNGETGFNQELIDKMGMQAEAATALLIQYGAVAGIEVTPMYGKFAFYEGVLGHFTFVLNAGAGVAATRVQLRAEQETNCGGAGQPSCDEAGFGATGPKFLGSVGAGFRVFLGERAAVRLEVRDLIYTARVDKINGCTYEDLESLVNGGTASSASCDPGKFASGSDPSGRTDQNFAKTLLRETSSDVLNNVFFFTGFSFLF